MAGCYGLDPKLMCKRDQHKCYVIAVGDFHVHQICLFIPDRIRYNLEILVCRKISLSAFSSCTDRKQQRYFSQNLSQLIKCLSAYFFVPMTGMQIFGLPSPITRSLTCTVLSILLCLPYIPAFSCHYTIFPQQSPALDRCTPGHYHKTDGMPASDVLLNCSRNIRGHHDIAKIQKLTR